MLTEHGEAWPRVFAEWAQRVVNGCEEGRGNTFSVFVYSETRRCFDGAVALRVPQNRHGGLANYVSLQPQWRFCCGSLICFTPEAVLNKRPAEVSEKHQ